MSKLINIPDCWYSKLKHVIESEEFLNLGKFIAEERKTKKVYPYNDEVFRVFKELPLRDVKVVIISQDPYPGEHKGEPIACGLSFAPRDPDYMPKSLQVIYNHLRDVVYREEQVFPFDLDLSKWVNQGVLLLNMGLTVEAGKPGSHLRRWEFFTKEVIKVLSDLTGVIFVFWGKESQQLIELVDTTTNYVLTASHPMASVYSGKPWECDNFERINQILKINNNEHIEWLNADRTK